MLPALTAMDLVLQDGPKKFTLTDEEERESSTVEIEARYMPVPVKLEARESINSAFPSYSGPEH